MLSGGTVPNESLQLAKPHIAPPTGGPCYSASAFHAFELSGASVCAMGAIEEGFNAEDVAFDLLDLLAAAV